MQSYCLICKKKVEMKPTSKSQNKNGTYTVKGVDSAGHKVAKIVSKADANKM